jgi:hypothetical protein
MMLQSFSHEFVPNEKPDSTSLVFGRSNGDFSYEIELHTGERSVSIGIKVIDQRTGEAKTYEGLPYGLMLNYFDVLKRRKAGGAGGQ